MGLLDRLLGKEDPEVKEAERRSYEKEREFVKREKKAAAIKEAGERGGRKAREGTGVGATLSKVGSGIIKVGQYGASLNWEGDTSMFNEPQERTTRRSSKSFKKSRKQQRQSSPFDLPEFPF